MISNQTVISIIPARGGSKGLKNKNLHPFLDIPLIGYTVNQSIRSKSINHTFVSTDDRKISEVAKNYGAKIILRPDHLCSDKSSSFTESTISLIIFFLVFFGIFL